MSVVAPKAIFLSYASQDTAAAQRICDALRAAGVEVWFDQNELVGGDAWDAKIRKQIKDCALFMPIISANTQARAEGYFRREWKLAVERTHDMADHVAFLVPVVIDHTGDAEAFVPEKFREVQWTRLPGGEATPKFCARVQALLRGGAELQPATPSSERELQSRATPAPPRRGSGMAWFVAAIVAASAGIGLYFAVRPAPATLPPAKTATAPLTEAQKLVAQARQVYEGGDEISRENLFYAEELVQKALTLDPTDPSAWEFGAWVCHFLTWHGFDDSEARRETMMRRVARAKALLPDSIPVRVCELTARLSLSFVGARQRALENPDIERELLALLERDPNNWLARRALGICYRLMNRPDDSTREFRRAIELSGGKPMPVGDLLNLWIRVNRYDEAERLLNETLPRQITGRLLTFDSIVRTRWRGDAASALRAVETWPSWFIREDRAIALAWQAAMWAREPKRALAAVVQARTDYVRDVNFSGPRAVLSARAHELAGNHEAAQTDWRVVLQRCEQDFAANPQDIPALCWKSWALARLGDRAGAQAAATLVRQRADSAASNYFAVMSRAQLWATVGWTDLAFEELDREKVALDRYTMTRAYLELEPAFDPIRDDPRFKALVAAAPAPTAPPAGQTADKSVAVLAFANLSDDKTNEYFSDGISEELLNVLAKVPGLKVSARTSAFSFKGKNTPIPEIAQRLGVAYVVEGSVRKAGSQVRITAQLIKAADGFHVWSDTFTRDLKDIFAVQDEIAAAIMREVKVAVMGATAGPRTAVTAFEAYTLYLQGQAALARRGEDALREAAAKYDAALKIDSNYVPALIGKARALMLLPNYSSMSGPAALALTTAAETAARRILELEPENAAAHATLGFILMQHRWRWGDADAAFRRALAAAPADAEIANFAGDFARLTGNIPRTIELESRALALDPLAVNNHWDMSLAWLAAGDYAKAIETGRTAISMAPAVTDAYESVVMAAGKAGRLDLLKETVAAMDRDARENDSMRRMLKVYAAITLGQQAEAKRELAGMEPLAESGRASPAAVGFFHLRLGNAAVAARWLDQAYEAHDPTLVWDDIVDLEAVAAAPETRSLVERPGIKELLALRRQHQRSAKK